MASLLDWDLQSQVMPTVRWLVQHRRAKVVDLVHVGLKTVFIPSPKFPLPLTQLTSEFEKQFSHPAVPSLPDILSTISSSVSKQSETHFFASVVKNKELIPLYHDVVLWLLKRDMLVTLHLHIRIVATTKLKVHVQIEKQHTLTKKASALRDCVHNDLRQELEVARNENLDLLSISGHLNSSLSPKAKCEYSEGKPHESFRHGCDENLNISENCGFTTDSNEDGTDESVWNTEEDHLQPSMISDPARATPLQRRWLAAMSEGKKPEIAKRFQRINQYFDGKKTDDEILYRAKISRKQLREVLHHYEEYLQTFLHPC